MEKELNRLTVLLQMNTELNIVNSRLIDVLELKPDQQKKYAKEIKDLKDEKKKLVKIIKEFNK
ncbi:MAG: hypothetical protein JXB50_08110 [Spirochaetes bacterium]|nr:hypothetical protein [Spirochaetota bacterium]